MVLKDRIESDFKEALKAKDGLRTSCLRMIKAAIINKEMEAVGKKIEDADIIAILTTLSKRAQESIEQFEKGGRADLAEKEKKELVIIKSYLPAVMSDVELVTVVDSAIAEAGAIGPKDMGKVMKILMPKTAGRANGKVVSMLVQNKLQNKSKGQNPNDKGNSKSK